MFKARQLCPNAVIIKPNMAKYVEASRLIKQRFLELTPLVQPLSLDEAFLDLTGTERLHHRPPALSLTRLARVVEAETGVTPELSTTGGTSDARFVKSHCPVVEFGLVGQTMHQVDERVELSDIHGLKAIYARILDDYFAS